MTNRSLAVSAATILVGLSSFGFQAFGWQSAIATLGLNDNVLKDTLLRVSAPRVPAASLAAARLMTPDQRNAAVREICAAMKALAGTDVFQRAYAEFIKQEYDAVDHGLKQEAPSATGEVDIEKMLQNAQFQTAVQMAMMFRDFPTEALQSAFEQNMQEWEEAIKNRDTDPEERASAQKKLAEAKALAPLLESDPEKFKKTYSLLKSAEIGGPSTEAGLIAAADAMKGDDRKRAEDQRKRTEQSRWDQYNFRSFLKKRLTDLVAAAATVDFDAQTQKVNGRDVFVNPAYERQSGEWKLMYRAGRGPVTAAADFAKVWLREL